MPSAPIFSVTCEVNDKSAEICISWFKPEGGNEIDYYIVDWMIEGNMKHSDIILYNGRQSNNYTINNLQPAQVVDVSIRASNSAGESEAAKNYYATGKYFLCPIIFFVL